MPLAAENRRGNGKAAMCVRHGHTQVFLEFDSGAPAIEQALARLLIREKQFHGREAGRRVYGEAGQAAKRR